VRDLHAIPIRQLGIMATLGVYFIRRFRWRGIAVGAVAAIPLLLLGGRSGEGAESSSEERLNCWNEAFRCGAKNRSWVSAAASSPSTTT
jgi:hypothetical protein